MKLIVGVVGSFLLIVISSGCKQQAAKVAGVDSTPVANATPTDAIRAAIDAHIARNGNLRRDSFDTEVKQVTLDGDRAQAQVEFRAKNGPGAMQLTYSLEKRSGAWVVAESTPNGSNFSHPTAGMPVQKTGEASVGEPSVFQVLDKMHDRPDTGAVTLPPGHPPINSAGSSPAQQP